MSVTTLPVRQPKSAQRTTPAIQITSFADLVQFANMAAKSQLVPKDYINRPENIMLAVQLGSEVGLSPMQALQNIAVVNGRPAIWGDAMPGLCRASAVCEDIQQSIEGAGDDMTAVCVAKRYGASPVIQRFSVADAKKAGLWSKQGTWQQYPTRMLQQRARGFALRDAFPDVLKGLISVEEARDIPVHREMPHADPTIAHEALQIDPLPGDAIPAFDIPPAPPPRTALQKFSDKIALLPSREACFKFMDDPDVRAAYERRPAAEREQITTMLSERGDSFEPAPGEFACDELDQAAKP